MPDRQAHYVYMLCQLDKYDSTALGISMHKHKVSRMLVVMSANVMVVCESFSRSATLYFDI